MNEDERMALLLQKQFDMEVQTDTPKNNLVYPDKKKKKTQISDSKKSLVDPSWELVDPTPNIHILFMAFNERFFWNKLLAVSVSWSKRMTTCAGICSYQYRGGLCKITLSEPLLKLRPRKDLIETLLHEMIHALLFVTHNNKDRDGHGPEFHKHMYRINTEAGTNISVYHDFHDEVRLYQQHWWRCDGPCQKRKPYFGFVRRAMNRAPGPNDRWWSEHKHTCGGTFIKVKEPEKNQKSKPAKSKNNNDISKFINKTNKSSNVKTISNIKNGGVGTKNKNGTVVLNPKTAKTNGTNKENKVPSKIGNIITIKDLEPNNNVIQKPNVTNTKISPIKIPDASPEIDYNVVRNKWLSKFDNTNKNVIKRKSTDNTSNSPKKLKSNTPERTKTSPIKGQKTLTDFYTSPRNGPTQNSPKNNTPDQIKNTSPRLSQTNLKNFYPEQTTPKKSNTKSPNPVILIPDGVNCPVCNKIISNSELNDHLDVCLQNEPKAEPENNLQMVQCPSCNTFVDENALNDHLDNCLNKEDIKNKPSTSKVNLMHCEICDNFVSAEEYAVHIEECLHKLHDDIDKKYNLNTTIETTSCLVCNEDILKVDLESHLDTCMGKAFDEKMKEEIEDEDEEEEEDKEKKEDGDAKIMEYNCPICLKPIMENDMNKHIDECLTVNHFNEFDDEDI